MANLIMFLVEVPGNAPRTSPEWNGADETETQTHRSPHREGSRSSKFQRRKCHE